MARIKGKQISTELKEKVKDFLRGYRMYGKLLMMDSYEKEFLKDRDTIDHGTLSEVMLAREKMYRVRHFINQLPNCDEKLFLYYHYVKGVTVERCGDMLDISRTGAFRMKERAICIAAEQFENFEKEE